jgi:hypothetical protein
VSKVKVKAEGKVKPSWIKEEGEKIEVQERVESDVIAKYSSNNDLSLFDNKVALAVEGLHPFYEKMLRERISKENALVISEYINSLRREINVSIGHRKTSIDTLVALAIFHSNEKDFKEMTREDILLYLDSLGKPESSDPLEIHAQKSFYYSSIRESNEE